MNVKITPQNLKTCTFHMLLSVLLITFLAVPGLAQQVATNVKEQPGTGPERTSPPSQPGSDLSKFAVFVSAGAVVPHGDLSTFLDPGFSVNGGLEYMITPQFSAEGTFGYHRFGTFFGDDAGLYQLSGNAKFYFVDDSSSVRPFVNGGVGAYVTDSGTSHFGGNVGVGVLFEVSPKVGVQGSYNFHSFTLSGDGARFSTVQGGIRFRF